MDERPAFTKHQKVVADAVVAALEPLLKEMNRKLDMIAEKLDIQLARLAEVEAAMREDARFMGLADKIDMRGRDKS